MVFNPYTRTGTRGERVMLFTVIRKAARLNAHAVRCLGIENKNYVNLMYNPNTKQMAMVFSRDKQNEGSLYLSNYGCCRGFSLAGFENAFDIKIKKERYQIQKVRTDKGSFFALVDLKLENPAYDLESD